MKIYLVDTGPHHSGKRWKYIAVDDNNSTDLYDTKNQVIAAWEEGKYFPKWRFQKKQMECRRSLEIKKKLASSG